MEHSPRINPKSQSSRSIVDPKRFGASFSIKQCRNFDISWEDTLNSLIYDLGLRRFRLMSYWDEHETKPGKVDFTALDKQIRMIEKNEGVITLCLGVRQPRWPESHWPDWAWKLPKAERDKRLLRYVAKVVKRYKGNKTIISWQLENEALLENFGERGDFDVARLKSEFDLVRQLDPVRPIIMTTSTSWGVPVRQPIPEIVGFSYYRTVFNKGKYRSSLYYPWAFKLRAQLIMLLHQKPSFIHELQAEPWGPKNIWEMAAEEQDKSMSPDRLHENIRLAAKTNLYPIDLWGAEWWYWRKINDDSILWETAKTKIKQ